MISSVGFLPSWFGQGQIVSRAGVVFRVALALAAGLLALKLAAAEFPRPRSVPGGVALLELGSSAEAPQASFDGVPVLVVGDPGGWTAVVGIPLAAEP